MTRDDPLRRLDAVHALASGVLGLRRDESCLVLRRRRAALTTVQRWADQRGLLLRGSWGGGDFHLDQSGSTLSDVDLFGRSASTESLTAAGLSRLRVAVHEFDYESRLTLRASFAFALVNLAKVRLRTPNDRYTLAKCRLMMSRRDVGERYADIAARIADKSAAALLAAKLGVGGRKSFTAATPIECPVAALLPIAERVIASTPPRSDLALLHDYIDQELVELGSHRHYVAAKVADLVAVLG